MAIPGRGQENASAFLPTQAAPEKRAGRRHPVVAPVVIRWKDTEDHEVSGVVRDVNDSGIFFFAEADIPAGARVELMFTVPRELTAPQTFRFVGTLVRTEAAVGSEKGFAIAVSRSELLGELEASEPFEALQVEEVDARAPGPGAEKLPATQPCQHSRNSRFRLMGIVAMVLGVLVLILAFAAKAIMARQQAARFRASVEQNIHVWVDPSTGLYHCPGTAWYGKKAGGKYVTQKQAQLDGFHPAYQRPCEVTPSRGRD